MTQSEDETQMEERLTMVHDRFHWWVGGGMANVGVSANDPLFYLHHAFIDKVWTDVQKRYPEWTWAQPEHVLGLGPRLDLINNEGGGKGEADDDCVEYQPQQKKNNNNNNQNENENEKELLLLLMMRRKRTNWTLVEMQVGQMHGHVVRMEQRLRDLDVLCSYENQLK